MKQKSWEDSSNKSPLSSLEPETEPERPSNDEETHIGTPNNNQTNDTLIMKTPWQVLEELGGYEDSGDGVQGGTHVAVGGGSMVVEGSVIASEGVVLGKKRKPSKLKDPPSGKPTCPICHKEFLTWKGAFGHMRKHPDRQYRGFFKPPVFDSTSTSVHHPPLKDNHGDGAEKSDGEEKSGERGSASASITPIRGLVFDLNQPMESFETAEENNVADGRDLGFDLNEMPSVQEDDE